MPYLHIEKAKTGRMAILKTDVLDVIRESFSVSSDVPRFGNTRFLPARKYAIATNGRFEVGLTSEILQFAVDTWRQTIDIKLDKSMAAELKCPLSMDLVLPDGITALRPYQQEAFDAVVAKGRGITLHPTAAGKTPLTGSIISSFLSTYTGKDPIVVLVPDTGLARQTSDDLKKYGIEGVQMWTGKNPLDLTQNPRVVVANHKITWMRLPITKTLSNAPLLIIDECHTINKGVKVNKAIDLFKTPNRIGLTGTLPNNKEDYWNVVGKIGPVIAKETASDLEAQGFIAPVRVIATKFHYADEIPKPHPLIAHRPNARYYTERQWLYANEFRNHTIATIANKLTSNTLVLVDQLDQGEDIMEYMDTPDKQTFFIHGAISVDERERIKQIMEDNDDVIIVAMMQIFKMGISINNLHNLILAALGKGRSRIIQSIGRGRRLHKEKDVLTLFDILDDVMYSNIHGDKRLKIYSEQKIPVEQKTIIQPCNPN